MEIAPLPAGLERLGAAASPEVRTLTIGRLIDDIRTRDIRTLTRSTRTLVHPHIGNTYVLPDGDVGFSRLAGSSERELVARSRLLLQGADGRGPSRAERDLVEEYRGICGSARTLPLRLRSAVRRRTPISGRAPTSMLRCLRLNRA